jgi:hypothetical protein
MTSPLTTKVMQYFSATAPIEVLGQLVLGLVRTTKQRPTGTLSEFVEGYEDNMRSLVEKETSALEAKTQSMKDHMKSKGLDRLIVMSCRLRRKSMQASTETTETNGFVSMSRF